MNKLLKQAFTLIELLVVIAIIGILSGLIVVSMSGVTQKASIAKAQVFSNSLRNSLMLNLVSQWNFDSAVVVADGSAVTSNYLIDSWGQKNGIVTANPPTVSSDCIYGSCLNFNGSKYISIADDAVFNFGAQMTAMLWTKASAQNNTSIISQIDIGTNQRAWYIVSYSPDTSYNRMYVAIFDDGTVNAAHYTNNYTNSAVFDGNWHLIGFTWSAGVLKLYVDGQSVPFTTSGSLTTNSIYNSTAALTIGSYLNNGTPTNYFTGLIDEVRLYNLVIPTSKIQEQYYLGLNKMLNNGNISREEYISRINSIATR
jgi:prepilin-type N-terminal cleavage/methylation domain-containing protein